MINQRYIDYFLKARSDVGQLDTIQLSHPNFTKDYYLVRNHLKGFTATLEDGVTLKFFEYVPMQIGKGSVKDDLDQTIDITLGDVREILSMELQNVKANNGFSIKPTLVYRTYRTDDLSRPLFGPVILEVADFQFTKKGASFQAKAPSLNVVKTGELYTLERFKMLRGCT